MNRIPEEKLRKICDEIDGEYGFYVSFPDEGERFAINENVIFNAASTIKIPILALLFRDFELGRLTPEQPTRIPEDCRYGGSGVLKFLSNDVTLTLYDFAVLMIIYSDNIATNVLIDILGRERINEFIKENGWNNTYLEGKLLGRLIGEGAVYNYTTANDLANMMERILRGELVSEDASRNMLMIMSAQQVGKFRTALPCMSITTTKMDAIPDVPCGKVLFASKGGTLMKTVSHDAAIMIMPNGRRAVLVLTAKVLDNSKVLNQFTAIAKAVYETLL